MELTSVLGRILLLLAHIGLGLTQKEMIDLQDANKLCQNESVLAEYFKDNFKNSQTSRYEFCMELAKVLPKKELMNLVFRHDVSPLILLTLGMKSRQDSTSVPSGEETVRLAQEHRAGFHWAPRGTLLILGVLVLSLARRRCEERPAEIRVGSCGLSHAAAQEPSRGQAGIEVDDEADLVDVVVVPEHRRPLRPSEENKPLLPPTYEEATKKKGRDPEEPPPPYSDVIIDS